MDSSQTNNISSLNNTSLGSGSAFNDPDMILLNQYFSQSDWIKNAPAVSHYVPNWQVTNSSGVTTTNTWSDYDRLLVNGRVQMLEYNARNPDLYKAILRKFEKDGSAPNKEIYFYLADLKKRNSGSVLRDPKQERLPFPKGPNIGLYNPTRLPLR